jgi:hypothetical protein
MREPLGGSIGRTVVRGLLLAATLSLALAGCGDLGDPGAGAGGPEQSRLPSTGCTGRASPARTALDLDGDGAADEVRVDRAAVDGRCRDALVAQVGGREVVAPLSGDLPVSARDLAAVAIPGRTGSLLLVRAQHPRGGFQAHLFGYAAGKLAELRAGGRPVFDFVATDTMSTPTAARCDGGGFAVLEARTHEPIGVAPAWDVFRTVYAVDGNTVTNGPTTEIADNVLDHDLQRRYPDLVDHDLCADCLAKR